MPALLALAALLSAPLCAPELPAMPKTALPDLLLAYPYRPLQPATNKPSLTLLRQDFETLERRRSILRTPLRVGTRTFRSGLGTHSVSHLRFTAPQGVARFTAWVGVDANERTAAGSGSVVCVVEAQGREVSRSGVLRGGEEAQRVDVALDGATSIDLRVDDGGDGPSCDHADWCDATVTLLDGKVVDLATLESAAAPVGARYPFSFTLDGRHSDTLLDSWARRDEVKRGPSGERRTATTWTDPASGLRVRCETVRWRDFPAAEWLVWFENTGAADTPILEDVCAADIALEGPLPGDAPFVVHRTAGGTPTPQQFEVSRHVVGGARALTLGAGAGRSSTQDFPFFKIETGTGSAIVAVGWSGCWRAVLQAPGRQALHITAGLERTRFVLHPGERVRGPRILVQFTAGDTREANALFRQLIYRHYAARRAGKPLLPTLFCNTCFTRGGGWLNECTAANQISLIEAYAPLGLEALLTDAGWFEGGWPEGAGNWMPRRDAYPEGMGPVAASAERHGMVYGLWFEPERVVAGTQLHAERPEWCLASGPGPQGTYLLDFGRAEVQEHFFRIVEGFMRLPGFRVYRQDFNMDPLPYWRHNDAPDRQGVTEMKYVEGLYRYWDRIAGAWPDSLREECASGGHRMDLETVMRMHLHQKTDYWFDNEVDQASLWALSQYLPNSTFVAPVNRMDDYSFNSVLPSALCMGWIADAPDFDRKRAKALLDRYTRLRHLLVGAWYPLTGCDRSAATWIASQYHRPDLDEGMIVAYRRADSPFTAADVRLGGLAPKGVYALRRDGGGAAVRATGAALARGYNLTIGAPGRSVIIRYRRVK